MPPRQPFDLTAQGRFVNPVPGAVSHNRTRPINDTANPPLRHFVLLAEIIGGSALLARAHHFFFGDVLGHLLIQEQLGNQLLESINLELQLSAPAIGLDLLGITLPAPPIVGGRTDAVLATDVGDGQSFGQIAVDFLQQPCNLVGGPSPFHAFLRELLYPETPISAGPVFGEQAHLPMSVFLSKLRGESSNRL
jgi:hypothetical protein